MKSDPYRTEACRIATLKSWDEITQYFHEDMRTFLYPPTVVEVIVILIGRKFIFNPLEFVEESGYVLNMPNFEHLSQIAREAGTQYHFEGMM